ncbi:hypothetical protein VII00023_06312 [Vibrio ichthyoenteri ATCC 700023]|uniref:DUF3726 domain-containing protein n=1 Tax=Vibrio ichthyoenteri ATCC 700023 TaxID=870968 RepID=F9S1Q4_9VIBR|nr:DUF3726 domain-containing protein [Vibrio ichthyoenteri]EGU41446.1 hypothetical protein VII00023_06312 [Vibrio ichthyoenteri ATCC 700023]
MIVSHNELVAAVNKAFVGMRRSCGEGDVIANMVADLQMVGLHGVRHFNNASCYIGLEDDSPVAIENLADGQFTIDLHGGSVACHLPVVIDYVLEKMVGAKTVSVTLSRCHNRWLAYSELVKLAAKGIACRACWDNGSSPKRTLYVLNRGCIAPELYFSDFTTDNEASLHSLTIELSVDDFNLPSGEHEYQTHVEAQELQQALQSAWQDGIFVDDAEWATLKQNAAVFLVENSQRSIQGAGELV